MLVELHLRDLGVIGEAKVPLSPGLNVVTGETGVGKTLLVSSLALLTGSRGHSRLVRRGASEAVVEAVVSPPARVRQALGDMGLPLEEELVLVRRLGADGRSRGWAGGQLVPMSTLAGIGAVLVEIHGQGAGFALASSKAQLEALDAMAKSTELLDGYRDALGNLRRLEREKGRLAEEEESRQRELDLLVHQAEEIERAEIDPDEEDRVGAAISRLEHVESLREIASEVGGLVGSDGASGELAEAHARLARAVGIDPAVEPMAQRLADVAAEASELAREVRAWSEELDADPRGLEALRERRALLASLKRKHGSTLAEMVEIGAQARRRISELGAEAERSASIDSELADAEEKVQGLASDLSLRRGKASRKLERLVRDELPGLALGDARFEVSCGPGERTETGADEVEFRFSASKRRPAEVIGSVASGGELSRAMIAVTLSLAQSHQVPVLVFDEADQGIGGEAALDLAKRLRRLGDSHQVLVVSHLPQIAAFAHRHLAVRKAGEEVTVEVLDDGAREAEVSRMLAGLGDSELARAHAAELLELSS